jgi:hypothetical protein
MNNYLLYRRQFLANVQGLVVWPLCRNLTWSHSDDPVKNFDVLRENLLQLINEEREVAKLPKVEIDELATKVANRHAEDMADGEFASHWGRDGLKPYHRYSFAGGYHATQENVSAADNTWSSQLEYLKQDTAYLHIRLYQETPPNDGHRKAILAPQNTHVGFGLAFYKLRLRMVELFVSKHVQLDPVAQSARPGAEFYLSGRLLKSSYSLNAIEIFYEPLPAPPELSWLRQPRSYALPDESRILKPIPPAPYYYSDGIPGVIAIDSNGSFRTPVKLFKNTPGIYTIVCWVKRHRDEKSFPATELCIQAA